MSGVSSSAVAPAEPSARRTGLIVLLVLLVAVALGLAVQSILSYRRALAVEGTLGRAQADAMLRTIGPSLRGHDDPDTLARLLDEQRGDGLRYIALIDPSGEIRLDVGDSVERATVGVMFESARGPTGYRIGTRWRVYSPPPPHPGGPGGRRGPPPGTGQPPPDAPPHHRGPPPVIAIEVEPSAGPALRREATRTLVVGLASALVLCGLAVLLVRWVRHRDRLEQRIAHDRRLAALGEMSAILAHEIRNPLASLKGHAQLLVENLGERDRDRAKATRIVDEAVRLERLTNDLLEFARTGRIARSPCDPGDVLATAAAASLDPTRITVERAGAPATWSLDAGRMTQVLANLLGNALEAAPDQPVTATVATERGQLVYRVRDRGPGLPAGGLPQLLEPFHTTRVKGVGLGLAVAHRLITLHGGTISGRTHPEGGAELTVTIPGGER